MKKRKEFFMSRYIQGSLFDYMPSSEKKAPVSKKEGSSSPSSLSSTEKNMISNPLFTPDVTPPIPVTNLPPEILSAISKNDTRNFKVGLKYGENIGGSHYDRLHLIRDEDVLNVLKDMTTAANSKIFNRDSLWPEPDWVKLADEGYDRHSLYRIKCIRQNISQKLPQLIASKKFSLEENLFTYSQMIINLRDLCMQNLNGLSNEKILAFSEEKKEKELNRYKGGYRSSRLNFFITDVVSLLQGKEEDFFDFQFKDIFIHSNMSLTKMYKALFLRSDPKTKLLNTSFEVDESVPFNTTGVVRQENWPYGPVPEWTNKYFVYNNIMYNIIDTVLLGKGDKQIDSCVLMSDENTYIKFETAKEAEEYAKKFYEQKYQQTEETSKDSISSEKERKKDDDDKRLGELIRPTVSEPYRNCKNYTQYDIMPEELLAIFGVRGIEFGKWLPPEERKGNINEVHAAFVDLCAVLELPLKAVSLSGELALAFGSRGIPSAAAHYESDKKVFNLTRFAGAGSAAHEWMHAIDYIVGRHLYIDSTLTAGNTSHELQNRPFTKEEAEEKLEIDFYKTLLLATQVLSYYFDRELSKGILFSVSKESLENRYDNFKKTVEDIIERYKTLPSDKQALSLFWEDSIKELCSSKNLGFYKTIDRFDCFKLNPLSGKKKKRAIGENFYNAVCDCRSTHNKIKECSAYNSITFPTHFYEDSKKLDALYNRNKPYWANEKELFARAGEFYIAKKLQKEGLYSQYLVFGATRDDPWTNDKKGNTILNPQLDLLQVVRNRELKTEELLLFKKGVSPYPKKEEEEYIFQTMGKIWEKLRPTIIEMTEKKFPDESLVPPPLPKPIAEKTKAMKQ